MSKADRPQVVVIGGPNGSGKTSAAPDLLHDTVGIDAFVNADVIAQGLAGFSPQSAALEAGRVMLGRLRDLGRARADFAFESTLSGVSAAGFLADLANQGYDVHIVYLWLPSEDLAVARVRLRVAAGGHDVPEQVIRRRFMKSLLNFDRLYRPIARSWRMYDGSAPDDRPLIAYGAGANIVIADARKWAVFRQQIEESA